MEIRHTLDKIKQLVQRRRTDKTFVKDEAALNSFDNVIDVMMKSIAMPKSFCASARDPLTPVVKYTGKRAGKYPKNKYNHICYNCPKFDDDVALKKGLPLCSPTLNPCKKLKEYL